MSSGLTADPDATLPGELEVDSEPAPPASTERAPGSLVDRYVITNQIGSGAMGVVYRAHDPSLDRVVALKLLHPSTQSDRRRSARLLGEAQALARLSGPHVVAVYDLGAVGDELYIAMEFVEGSTLSAWLEAEPRSLRELIAIFAEAARGLATAHAAELVHGDFKPANVMVDTHGHAKVLDFGLARPDDLSTKGSEEDGKTRDEPAATQALVGTPGYMAAEIFEGKPLTARSDQFAFCVAFWEALFRQRPFPGATVLELTAAVVHGRAPTAPKGHTVPRWLVQALLRGMSRDPGDRWPSMLELVEHLEIDRPRRRRLAAAAFVGVVVAGLVGWSQTRPDDRARCESGAELAMASWAQPKRQALRTAILDSKLPYAETTAQTVDTEVDEFLSAWKATHVTTCLASPDVMPPATRRRAERCLGERREQYVAVMDALRGEGDKSAEKAVEVVGALESVANCSDITHLQYFVRDPEDPVLAKRVAYEEGRLAAADAANQVGQFDTAIALATQVAAAAGEIDFPPLEIEAHLILAKPLLELGRFDETREHLRVAYSKSLTENLPEASATAATRLIGLEGQVGDGDKAREWAFHARSHLERPGMPESMWGNFHSSMGQVEGADQRVALAIEHLEAAVAVSEKILGDDHWVTAFRRASLAVQLRRKGEGTRARALQESALEVLEKRLGAQHPRTGLVENNLGLTLMLLGESEAAIEHLTRALDILSTTLPPGHPTVAYALTNLSSLELNVGNEEKALDYCQQALVQRERALDPEHPHVGYTLVDCGDIQRRLGRHEDALETLARARVIAEAQGDPNHPGLGGSLVAIGRTLTDMGRAEEAVPILERAVGVYQRPRDEYGGGERAIAELSLAHARRRSGQATQATRTLAAQAIESLEATPAAAEGALARDLEGWRATVEAPSPTDEAD